MTKLLTAAVLAIALTTAVPAEAHHQRGPCPIDWRERWLQHRDTRPIRALIRCAAERFGVSSSTAIRVASCETGGTFSPIAGMGDSDPFRGVFQHHRGYWPGRVATFTRARWDLRPSIYNARTQAIVTARMVRAGGWSPWGCY